MKNEIENAIEALGDPKVLETHIWKLGEKEIAANLSIISDRTEYTEFYKKKAARDIPQLVPYLH